MQASGASAVTECAAIPFVMSGTICGLCRIRYLTRKASCVCEQESVMGTGRFDFRSAGPLACENTLAPLTSEPPAEPELPIGQKIVLLKLRKGDLAATILDHLHEMSAPEPTKADWSAMIEARYIRRDFSDSDTGRLVMMPAGLSKCHGIMRDLAKKLSIHQFERSGGTRAGLLSQCSCGWQSSRAHYSQGGQSKLNSVESFHIKIVETGKWPPRPIEEFLNEVMPLRLPFGKQRQS
jgi:hypothetical protein